MLLVFQGPRWTSASFCCDRQTGSPFTRPLRGETTHSGPGREWQDALGPFLLVLLLPAGAQAGLFEASLHGGPLLTSPSAFIKDQEIRGFCSFSAQLSQAGLVLTEAFGSSKSVGFGSLSRTTPNRSDHIPQESNADLLNWRGCDVGISGWLWSTGVH